MTASAEWEEELVALLEEPLSAGWGDAVRSGNEARVLELKRGVAAAESARQTQRAQPGRVHGPTLSEQTALQRS
jgi:hypothetical protein